MSNLKQIGLALLNYEQTNGRLPPAAVADKQGKAMHSWRTLILPYLERNATCTTHTIFASLGTARTTASWRQVLDCLFVVRPIRRSAVAP